MGPYCNYCGRRCFVLRVYPSEGKWQYTLMATCDKGMQNDRDKTGYDQVTATNPVLDPRFAIGESKRILRLNAMVKESLSITLPQYKIWGRDAERIIIEMPDPYGEIDKIYEITIREVSRHHENEESPE